jgi:predicted DNA-binding transcriptional regulator AlpA
MTTKSSTTERPNDRGPNANDLLALRAITSSGGEALINSRLVRQLIGGVSRATLYRMLAGNSFPKPICVTPGRKAWPLSTVQAWIRHRVAQEGPDECAR